MDIFPKESIEILPFAPEPISEWTEDNDIATFVSAILPFYKVFFRNRRNEFLVIANDFSTNALKTIFPHLLLGEVDRVDKIPNFYNDANFGLAAKYAIAWYIVAQALLEESEYFSLPHILESYSEVECMILLASHLYYKQSYQVLRSFVESVTLQLYFCDNAEAYNKWKTGNYRTPYIRGKGRVLENLVGRELIEKEIADMGSELYGFLNGSIHGAEPHLIYRGVFKDEDTRFYFKYDRFEDWCINLTNGLSFALFTQYATIRHWHQKRYEHGFVCAVCHSDKLEYKSLDHLDTTMVTCCECGDVRRISTKWLSEQGYI